MMLKTAGLLAVIAMIAAVNPMDAQALPFAKSGIAQNETVVLVREGCGLGYQYSARLRRCVASTPGSVVRDVVRDIRCGPGFRFSDRLRRCVRI
jgi:hypothetical protein